jgi:hypothetical protein
MQRSSDMSKFYNEMRKESIDIVSDMFAIPKIQLILNKDENFYEVQQEEKEEIDADPFNNLNMALLEQKKSIS